MAFLEVEYVSKIFPEAGGRSFVYLKMFAFAHREKRIRYHGRPLGLRQEHVTKHHRRA